MKQYLSLSVTLGILGIVTLAFLGGSFYFFSLTWKFLRIGVPAKAEIIDFVDIRIGKDSKPVMAPKFRFQTKNGETIEATGDSSSNPPAFEVGETVEKIGRAHV